MLLLRLAVTRRTVTPSLLNDFQFFGWFYLPSKISYMFEDTKQRWCPEMCSNVARVRVKPRFYDLVCHKNNPWALSFRLPARFMACLVCIVVIIQELSPPCHLHLELVIREQQNNYRLDPQLVLKCTDTVSIAFSFIPFSVIKCWK